MHLYVRLRFGGRHPLCGMGVTSVILTIRTPAIFRPLMLLSLPCPIPLIYDTFRGYIKAQKR